MNPADYAKILKEWDAPVLSSPLTVVLQLTSRCNLKCKYCFVDAGLQQEKELKKEELLNLIDEFYSIGVGELILFGGEPLCRQDTLEIAQYADEQGFSLNMSTNGTLIDMKTASNIASSGISGIVVSIEGNEEQHEALTGVKGSYRKSLKALENFERAGINNLLVENTVTTTNIEYVPSLIRDIHDNTPANAIRLLRFLPMGRGEEARSLEVPTEELKKLYLKVQEVKKEIGESFLIIFADAFNAPFFDYPSRPCTVACSACCITPEGYVIPCIYFSSPDVLKIIGADNVREKKFTDIWRSSPLFQKFRNPFNELKGKCKTCPVAKECRGGCRAVSFSYSDDLFNMGACCTYEGGKS